MKCERCDEQATIQVGNDAGDSEQARQLVAALGFGPPPTMLCGLCAIGEVCRRMAMYGAVTYMEIDQTSGAAA